MKKVLIATPCLYGKVDAYYVHSLSESIKLGLMQDIEIRAIFLANESILPMARNELLNLSYTEQYDVTIFIDDDEYWDPQVLIDIIQSEKDVITVPVVNKGDKVIQYNIFLDENNIEKDHVDGYITTRRTGTGFLKLSKKVVSELWNSNPDVEFRGKILKYICEYSNIASQFVGEDIMLSQKISELGYKIWVNPHHTVSHLGNKMYRGDFKQTFKHLL